MKYVLVLKELNNNQPQTANAVWGFSFFYFFLGGWARRAQAQLQVACDTMSSINIWDFMLYVIHVSRETFYVKQGSSAIPDGA